MTKVFSTVVVVLALVAAVPMGACNRAPNPQDNVERALKDANLKDVNVDYDRNEQVVHLKGAVDNTSEKARAEEIASRAVGTSGRVLNELTVKGVDENTADNNDGTIRDRLNDMVKNDPDLKDADINFDVNNGAVEVKGNVPTAAEKDRVTQMVRSVDGVKDVANALEIKPKARK
jgi:hyperosmotically inducible periplasmic protein